MKSTHCAICACITFFWCIIHCCSVKLLDRIHIPWINTVIKLIAENILCLASRSVALGAKVLALHYSKIEKNNMDTCTTGCKHRLSRHHPVIKQAPKWLSLRSVRCGFYFLLCLSMHPNSLFLVRAVVQGQGTTRTKIFVRDLCMWTCHMCLERWLWLYSLFELEVNVIWIPATILLGQLAASEKGRALLALPKSFIPLSWVWHGCCYFSTPSTPVYRELRIFKKKNL
jgi:hypothetical protein